MNMFNVSRKAEALSESVDRTIAVGDGMYVENHIDHYFSVGASALTCIQEAMAASQVGEGAIQRVLDYACGYGRVLRWLRAAFPKAYLLGVDADPKAIDAASVALGVATRKLDISLSEPLDAPFDLIWIGSLITHLPEAEAVRVIRYCGSHLTAGGVLVFTTHGRLVQQRLSSRTRTYNLTDEGVAKAVEGYDKGGYGFAEYKNMKGYGISVAKPDKVVSMVKDSGLELSYFKAIGWAEHQDVCACVWGS